MPILIFCSAGIRTVARSVCQDLFRSYLMQYCLDGWARELGSITTWLATPLWVLDRASFLFVSTVHQKSPCTAFVRANGGLIWFVAQVGPE